MTRGTSLALTLGLSCLALAGVLYAYKNGIGLVQSQGAASVSAASTQKQVPFGEFVQGGGSYSCMVKASLAGQSLAGQVYTDAGMVRGEWSGMYVGKDVTATFIMRGGYTYAWNSLAASKGIKLRSDQAIDPKAFEKAGITFITPNSPNGYLNAITDYQCSPWTPDTDIFIPPNTVTFTSIS